MERELHQGKVSYIQTCAPETQVRTRLAAGGRRIRTLGPARLGVPGWPSRLNAVPGICGRYLTAIVLADKLKPFRPNEGRQEFFIFAQQAVVRRAQHVVDSDAVLGERKQSTPI
jgi:hypothetical protein